MSPTRSPMATTARVTRSLARLAAEIALAVVRSALWVGFTTAGTALNIWAALLLLLLITPNNVWGYAAGVFGAAVVGCAGGLLIGIGQVLALRRWLDGAASLGSFLSTVLASSGALSVGTGAGWWAHSVSGDLAGALTGVIAYGTVFGFVQRPMLDYMAPHSFLWVPVNAISALLGAMAVLAAFDISGGRRDMLQFRYAGIAYSLVTGAAFLWLTRHTRKTMAVRHSNDAHAAGNHPVPEEPQEWELNSVPGREYSAGYPMEGAEYDPGVLEVHEHRVYRVQRVPGDTNARHSGYTDAAGRASEQGGSSNSGDGPDVVDAIYRVIP
jgi:hypothetical protein